MAKVNLHLLSETAIPPGKEAADNDPAGFGGTNFDANMVIILAALLCALICALGLNSIVRCALRCSRSLTDEEREQEAAAAAARRGSGTGMKKSALRRMPVAVYGSDGVKVKETETECPICLAEFADGEKIRVLPKCNHCFHMRCIDTWLTSHSSCPTCRRSLLDGGAGGGRRADALVIVVG